MMIRQMTELALLILASLSLEFCEASRDWETDIDDETSLGVLTTMRRHDGKVLRLRASDEYNTDGRGFGPGEDEWFEAIEKPDDTNQAIQFYNSSRDYVTTKEGALTISTRAVKTNYSVWVDDRDFNGSKVLTKNYTSGMVQSWNKFCFTGGVLEMRIQLPGHVDSGGIWPAAWLMGNLARGTYMDSVMYQWPWSYNKCREDSVIPGFDPFGKQEINACDPDPGFGMRPHQGRGSPEIDIFEVMPGHEMPMKGKVHAFMSNSLQVSPGIPKDTRPTNGKPLVDPETGIRSNKTWYEGIRHTTRGQFNDGFWGQECGPEHDNTPPPQLHKWMEDAISLNSDLYETHFEDHHTYRLEWQPPRRTQDDSSSSSSGYLEWWLDDEFIFGVEGESLEQLTGSEIPFEPMYMILNTAVSHRWGMPEPCPKDQCGACWICYDCLNPECQCSLPKGMQNCKNLPAEMSIDWIRLYQDEDDETHTMACSPPNYPTAEFIEGHKERYADWKPYVGPVKTWIPGMVTDAVKSGENKVNHFLKVIKLHFNIFLFPLFLVWLGIGIFIGIRYCNMSDNLEEVRHSVRQRLQSIGSISSSLHSNPDDGEPSPDRKSIELHRRQSNKALFGIESPARPSASGIISAPTYMTQYMTQYQSLEMSSSHSVDNLSSNDVESSVSLIDNSGIDETRGLVNTQQRLPLPPGSSSSSSSGGWR